MTYGRAQRHLAKCLQFVQGWGAANVFVLTVTFADRNTTTAEAQRRFHSFATGLFGDVSKGRYVKFLEFQKRGTPHYHIIFYFPGAQEGSYWINGFWYKRGEAFQRMVDLCSVAREKYGFGRTTVEPVRPGAETAQVVKYLFKYFFKSMRMMSLSAGSRLISYGRALATGLCQTLLSIDVSKRQMLAAFCEEVGLDPEDLPSYAESLRPWLKPGLAMLELWRQDICEHWRFCQSQPF